MQPQYEAVHAAILEYSEKWQNLLGLDWLSIEHKFFDAYFTDEDYRTTAVTEAEWEYRHARIHWYLPSAARSAPADLEAVVVHEFVHVLLDAMESHVPDKYAEQCEFVVESVARSIMRVERETLDGVRSRG